MATKDFKLLQSSGYELLVAGIVYPVPVADRVFSGGCIYVLYSSFCLRFRFFRKCRPLARMDRACSSESLATPGFIFATAAIAALPSLIKLGFDAGTAMPEFFCLALVTVKSLLPNFPHSPQAQKQIHRPISDQ